MSHLQEPCKQIMNVETISKAFMDNIQELSNKIVSCFYSCFQQIFVKWAIITYPAHPDDFVQFIANTAFTDGILKLKETATNNGLYNGQANIQTIVLGFCRMSLKENLQREIRLQEKNKKLQPIFGGTANAGYVDEEPATNEKLYNLLQQALSKIDPQDRQIIQWRHIDEKPNDEIAALLGITTPAATNRIYRCMERLRKLTENLNEET